MRRILMNNPWKDLPTPARDVSAKRVRHDHPLGIFWAKDQAGNYLFICELDSSAKFPKKLPKLSGVNILAAYQHNRLILHLNRAADWELFFTLCMDILNATSSCTSNTMAIAIILNRLERWQSFLKLERKRLLSENDIKGLLGELLFLDKEVIPEFGAAQSVRFWQGPLDSPQDFNINDCAIEVKCQLGTTNPYIQISSADQLCPQLPNMFLYVVTLGKADIDNPDALNLLKIIEELRTKVKTESVADYEYFNELIFKAGYLDGEDYSEFNYVTTDLNSYSVSGEFPKICSDNLHPGVTAVQYRISLNECINHLTNLPWKRRSEI
jgi:hypothetical protein